MKIVGTLIGEALAVRGLAQNSFHNPLLVARRMIAYCHNNPDGALADGALPAAALDILGKLTRTARSTKLQRE